MNYDFGTVGVRAERTHTPREVLWRQEGAVYLPAGKVIDGSKSRDPLNAGSLDVLRPGLLMGRITASGRYAPSILGLTTENYTSGGTSLSVSPATAVEIVRRIGTSGTFHLTHAPTAVGTVVPLADVTFSAVNTSTGVITVTDIGANVVAGSIVQPDDGSEVVRGILDEFVKVTDEDGTDQGTRLRKLLVGGLVDAEQILNYPASSNTTLRAWLKDQLSDPSASCGPFLFKDNF